MLDKLKPILSKIWNTTKVPFALIFSKLLDLLVSKEDYLKLLEEAGVPENLHEQAIASLTKSRYKFYTDVIFHKVTAWFFVGIAVPFMKWEDNELPKWARRWNNNISPHGDALTWGSEKGFPAHELAPLDKNVRLNAANEPLCYYRKGNPHVREKLSMYVWMGLRNPGAGRALQVGEKVGGLSRKESDESYRWNTIVWGQEEVNETILGIRVHNIGSHWQIEKYESWKTFTFRGKKYLIGFDTNFGYKINNLHADYDPRNPEASICVCHTKIPFIVKVA